MKVDDSLITGLFSWHTNLAYTKGDMIIDSSELYVVIVDFNSSKYTSIQDALSEDKVDTYSNYHSYQGVDTPNDDDLITSKSLRSILNAYYGGLNFDGSCDRASQSDLWKLNRNGSYTITLDDTVTATGGFLAGLTNISGDYILKVSKSTTTTLNDSYVIIVHEFINSKHIIYRVTGPNGIYIKNFDIKQTLT